MTSSPSTFRLTKLNPANMDFICDQANKAKQLLERDPGARLTPNEFKAQRIVESLVEFGGSESDFKTDKREFAILIDNIKSASPKSKSRDIM